MMAKQERKGTAREEAGEVCVDKCACYVDKLKEGVRDRRSQLALAQQRSSGVGTRELGGQRREEREGRQEKLGSA